MAGWAVPRLGLRARYGATTALFLERRLEFEHPSSSLVRTNLPLFDDESEARRALSFGEVA